jgi:hypothetical protein
MKRKDYDADIKESGPEDNSTFKHTVHVFMICQGTQQV